MVLREVFNVKEQFFVSGEAGQRILDSAGASESVPVDLGTQRSKLVLPGVMLRFKLTETTDFLMGSRCSLCVSLVG